MPDPRLIILVTLITAAFVAGWKVKAWQVDAETLAVQQTREAAMEGAAAAIAKIKVENKTVYQKVQREVIEKPVYRDCKHDPETRAEIDKALTGGAP